MELFSLEHLKILEWKGTAKYVFEEVDKMIRRQTNDRAWVKLTEVRENEKNSAIYRPN